ncbi:flagellar basal body L-ring protein FlgH [Pedomonas mirosovicensis]|uniref:flagellar basal body L-ring protein FlgH n=1 Tax=Pedomonas mirosovicensis TaxID=2908641 RepID=UPI002168F33C|nr:flagellar basal body L-ring protein FlgH [Pedomonas mirosovicensis]MCH8685100.1 flagellar basal body L-ring protein FlgH [Pedomonas mirosovicensis]
MWIRLLTIGLAASTLAACGTAERIANIGRAPNLSPIEGVTAPQMQPSLASQQQMTAVRSAQAAGQPEEAGTSLWRAGSRAFFRDPRASQVGDILTVQIDISDQAQVNNTTSRSRSNSEAAGLPGFLGLESKLNKVLPNAVDPSSLVDASSNSSSSGTGQVNRKENINLTIAAIVTGVLPNGNLVIQGKQEVRVNYEVRELVIAGIVRPEDISRDNTINHSQIAEARISYGGRGQLTDVQQARYGQQLYDALFPF